MFEAGARAAVAAQAQCCSSSGAFSSDTDPKVYGTGSRAIQELAIDMSQYRLLFEFFLLYTDRVPFGLLDSAAFL
jgi:hypothetical protein